MTFDSAWCKNVNSTYAFFTSAVSSPLEIDFMNYARVAKVPRCVYYCMHRLPDIWLQDKWLRTFDSRTFDSGQMTPGQMTPDIWLQDIWLRTFDSGHLTPGQLTPDNWLKQYIGTAINVGKKKQKQQSTSAQFEFKDDKLTFYLLKTPMQYSTTYSIWAEKKPFWPFGGSQTYFIAYHIIYYFRVISFKEYTLRIKRYTYRS